MSDFPCTSSRRPAAPWPVSSALPHSHLALLILCALAVCSPAASIRGVITDATGAKVTGAGISLFSNGKVDRHSGIYGRWQL